MRLLVLDNYDSFTYNLVHLIEKCTDIPFDVFRNNELSLDTIDNYDKILLSPGPGLPSQAGIMPQLLNRYARDKSILGVCLGLQGIGECFGTELRNLEQVMHGLATPINIIASDLLFEGCPRRFNGGRYHSWVINETRLPKELIVTALDDEGRIMAAKHKTYNVRGVQFHPESILSEHGERMIANWLKYP